MKKGTKKKLSLTISGTILTFFLSLLLDWLKEKPILSSIWSIIKWIVNLFWQILNFNIKVWWLILAIIFILLVLFIADKLKFINNQASNFKNYNEDKINDWKWTWQWSFNQTSKTWQVLDLEAHCPNCDTGMRERRTSDVSYFDCPRCNFKDNKRSNDESEKVQRIIIDNMKRKEK